MFTLAALILLLSSCAPRFARGPEPVIFFGSDKFTVMGDAAFRGPGGGGKYSFIMRRGDKKDGFVLTDELGMTVKNPQADAVARMLVSVLSGRCPEFTKKIRRKGDRIIFYFSGNQYSLKKLIVISSDGAPKTLTALFRRGRADIRIFNLTYEN